MKKVVFVILIIVFISLLICTSIMLSNYNTGKLVDEIKSGDTYTENTNSGENVNYLDEESFNNSVTNLDEASFNSLVLNSDKKVMVDFYADWCGPCQEMSPIIDEVAQENNSIKVYRVNIDEESELANQYRIIYIPTLVLFESGDEIDRSIGLISKDQLIDFINNVDTNI